MTDEPGPVPRSHQLVVVLTDEPGPVTRSHQVVVVLTDEPGRPADQAQANFEPLKFMQWVLRCVNSLTASMPRSSPRPDILWPSYGTLTGR